MLNQISVKSRLLLLVCLPLLLLIAISAISIKEMGFLSDGATSIYQDRVVPLKQIKQVADAYAVTSVDLLHKYRGELLGASEVMQQLQQQSQFADQVWQTYLATTLTAEEAVLAEKAKQQILVFRQKLQDYQPQIADGSLLQRSAKDFNTELYQLVDPLSLSLAKLIDEQLVEAEKFKVTAAEQYQFFLRLFVIALFVVFICLGILSWFIYRSIHSPLNQLQHAMSVVGDQSDLRVRAQITGNDEIAITARAFNQTISRVHQFFSELGDAVSQLAAASKQMNQISQQVSGTAVEQEQQASLIAAAVHEMSAAIQQVANSALATSEQANDADQKTRQGYQKVIQNVSSIEQLSTMVDGASVVIEQLNGESEKITQVLAVIQTIAGQTNLLALNAAIEAARAGEAGRGFAVVADEVRTLATNTQKATESIRTMIDNLQGSASEAVQAMSRSGQYASISVTNAQEAGKVLEDIKSAVGTIVDMNIQISAATEEQTVVAEDINKNISEFSVSIGEMTRSATYSADTSASLAQLAARLQQQAASYRV